MLVLKEKDITNERVSKHGVCTPAVPLPYNPLSIRGLRGRFPARYNTIDIGAYYEYNHDTSCLCVVKVAHIDAKKKVSNCI